MKKPLFVIFLLLSVSTCMTQKPIKKPVDMWQRKLEPLLSYQLKEDKIHVQVTSTGCTHADDFLAETQLINNQCQINIYRIKPDYCRRAPFPVSITLPIVNKGQCEVYVLNKTNLKTLSTEK